MQLLLKLNSQAVLVGYKNMKKNLFPILLILLTSLYSQNIYSAVVNETAADAVVCVASGAMLDDDTACKTTPSQYSIKIYEMGLCTAHPYGDKTEIEIDKSSCTVTYTDTAPTAVDVAADIGTTLPLTGKSTPPSEGTYTYAYLILGQTFEVSGTFTNTSGGTTTTYYSAANNGVSTDASDFATTTDNLVNFGDTTCSSGYIGAAVTGGTLDGFITNTAFSRSEQNDVTSNQCDKRGRLIGVMILDNPVVVTSETIAVIFNFIVTDFGVEFGDSNDAGIVPEDFGSGPFSGYFTVK